MKYTRKQTLVDQREIVIGEFQSHEVMGFIRGHAAQQQVMLDKHDRRVLILHTGGTIGMFASENGYRPEKDRFNEFLRNYPYFCDEKQTYFSSKDDFIISPETVYGRRIWYKLQQMKTLIDSSNMCVNYWNLLLEELSTVYNDYDAFVILHGTDTMSFTASVLSFAIENLSKTIILTGAQIPISETRNDSINNLLCSLVIAGHFTIPEVLIVFDNQLLRGNRCKKRSTSSLTSFYCPNFANIGTFGLTIKIHWKRIIPVKEEKAQVNFIKLTQKVANIKLTPGVPTIPSEKYVVIESFGCGNMPMSGVLHDWLKQNSTKSESEKQLILNISQVENSMIVDAYQAGSEVAKLGVISGTDMTLEAAFAKLLYLSSKGYSYEEIRKHLSQNMRGQLTEKSFDNIGFLSLLRNAFANKKPQYRQLLYSTIYPSLAIEKSNSSATIEKLIEFGMDIKKIDSDGKSLLHNICADSQFKELSVLDAMIRGGVDPDMTDRFGNSAAYYALKYNTHGVCERLLGKGSKIIVGREEMFGLVRDGNLQVLMKLQACGEKFDQRNSLQQNLAMFALIVKNSSIVELLRQSTDMFKQSNINKDKDRVGRTLADYLKIYSL